MKAPAESRREIGPVSAVVVNYDGERHLRACLDALFAQTLVPAEVLVVDNASQDQSLVVLRERYPSVAVLQLPSNRGPCPARNAGLRAARHPWVLLLDNDAVLEADALEKLTRAVARDPRAVLAQPRSVLDHEPCRVHYDGGSFHYVGLYSLRNFYRPLAEAEGRGTVEVDGAVSVALLADRDVLLAWGGFDESFFILFEDLDLSYRLRLQGHRILSVEDAIARHRSGTPGISFREAGSYPKHRVFFHSRNRWLTLIKNFRWRTLLVSLPGLILYEILWVLFALGSGAAGAYVAGKWGFFRCLPGALRHRAKVQRTRRARDRDLLVGGPLTLAPHLAGSGLQALALRAVDRGLALWWRLARRFAG